MKQIKFNLENCYGIKKFNHTFDFVNSRALVIYAPNGVMKTSFAKTLNDYKSEAETSDNMFPERTNVRTIKDETGSEVEPDQIFVIRPYDEDYQSESISTLLVNQTLKKEYDSILKDIDSSKKALLKEIKDQTGLGSKESKVESELCVSFQKKMCWKYWNLWNELFLKGSQNFPTLYMKKYLTIKF